MDDFDWKAAYGRLRAQHQRAVNELHNLRALNAGLLATLDEINSRPGGRVVAEPIANHGWHTMPPSPPHPS